LSIKILPTLLLLTLATGALPTFAAVSSSGSPSVQRGDFPSSARGSLVQALAARATNELRPAAPLGVPTWLEQKVVASDGVAGDLLGFSVAIDGDTALVGAAQGAASGTDNGGHGAVYVYARQGGVWTPVQTLTADDGADNDQFGYAVALQGDAAVVGAIYATIGTNARQGAVYVFERSGATWAQSKKLVADDGAASDTFGWSVAIDGSEVAVGAPGVTVGGNSFQGAVYVFTADGSNWAQSGAMTADDGASPDGLGFSVAVHGDAVLAGALNAMSAQGAAYLFTQAAGTWTQAQKITAADGAAGDSFGYALAFDGVNALVGSPFAPVGANLFQGALYPFAFAGGMLSPLPKIVTDDGQSFDVIGISVSLSGNNAVGTAPFFNGSQGTAYLFSDTGAGWTQQQKFVASDAVAGEGAAFGYCGAISGNTILIGQALAKIGDNTNQGAAYFYDLPQPDAIFADGFDSP
jgi:hypothetical protein